MDLKALLELPHMVGFVSGVLPSVVALVVVARGDGSRQSIR